MYFFYILKKYLKNFLIIFIAVSFLYAVVSMLFSISKMPSSSNLIVLYLFYVFTYASLLLYPLSLVFAFLLTLNQMIKFNELVSFYSLGFSPKKIFKPFLLSTFFITLTMLLLQSTKLAYTNEYAQAIKDAKKLNTEKIFLKYDNKIIYIKKLNPVLKTAQNITVVYMKNQNVTKVVYTKKAVFKNDIWITDNADILIIGKKRWIKEKSRLLFLKNFKPKILSNLQKLREMSLYDAYITLKYFKNIDLNTILSIVFFKIFTPLSIIALIYYIFMTSPIHVRVSNTVLFMVKSVSLSVLVWGGMLILFKFAKQGVLPFWSLSFIFIILIIFDIYITRRNNEFS